jgi:hypothetical protein
MPISLPLVIEAVSLVEEAAAGRRALDVATVVASLLEAHPESDAAPEEIAAVLHQEQDASRLMHWS